jgi:hypothetical protein
MTGEGLGPNTYCVRREIFVHSLQLAAESWAKFAGGTVMKRTYEAPVVTDLGSVSEMTRGMGGAYGEFVQPGGLGMVMRMRMRMGGDDG